MSQKHAATETDIITHLIQVERRSLHLKKAYKSLFQFVFDFLKCSESTAFRRVTVTRAAMKFPIILDLIRQQRATLSSLSMIAPHLTEENHHKLLHRISGCSKREVERLVAGFSPTKSKRDIIRPVAVNVPKTPFTGESKSTIQDIAATPQLADKIERLKEIHAHKLKDGSLAEVLEMAVDMLLDKTAPERKTEPKRKNPPTPRVRAETRRPPAALQRQVWKRNAGQCTFTDRTGKRCSARGRLQMDHIHPWALGGSSRTADILRLLCQAHNLFEAEKYFRDIEPRDPMTPV